MSDKVWGKACAVSMPQDTKCEDKDTHILPIFAALQAVRGEDGVDVVGVDIQDGYFIFAMSDGSTRNTATHINYLSDEEKTLFDTIERGAQKNVQADWNEQNSKSDAYIKNKPNIPSGFVIDEALSLDSSNSVQNKVITAELNRKQGTITDLADIRSGAGKGATAVQSVKINGKTKTPNANGVVDLGTIEGGGASVKYQTLDGTATTVYVEKDTINHWALSDDNTQRTVSVNDAEYSNGSGELWLMVGSTKPKSVEFNGGTIYWQGDKLPQFDVNKMYKICFVWNTLGTYYASWEEYPLYKGEGKTIPITVIDFNIKTSYGDALNPSQWALRKEPCLTFLRGDESNDKGYVMPKADIIGLQEIYIHGDQWNDIQEYFSADYASIIANRGDSSTIKLDSEACAILYRKDRFTRVSGGFFWLRGGGWNGDTGNFNQEGFATWDKSMMDAGYGYENYKRIAVWIILRDITTGKEFFVLNTHYNKYFFDDGKTVASTPYYSSELVKNRIEALSGGRPVIFMGDLHCNPDKSAIAILKPDHYSLRDTRDEADEVLGMKYTMNSWAEENVSPTYALFDYIMVKGDWKVNQYIVPYAKVGDRWISDHNPVVADLYLKV